MERRLLLGEEALAVPSTAPYTVRFPMSEGKLNVTPSYPLQSVLDDITDLWHYLALKATGQQDSAEYSVGPTQEQLKEAAEECGIPREAVRGLSGEKGGQGRGQSTVNGTETNGLNGVASAVDSSANGGNSAVGNATQVQAQAVRGHATGAGPGAGTPGTYRRFPRLSRFSGVLVVPATLSSREVLG